MMRKLQITLLVSFMAHLSIGYSNSKSRISIIMEQYQIIPDVIDAGPHFPLKIIYEGHVKVDRGLELTPTDVKHRPKVIWCYRKPISYYTLIFIDPDAPCRSNPTQREFLHWLVVNIPGNKLNAGETITQYIGSAPPKYTKLHRYVFLLFKQPCKQFFNETYLTNKSAIGRSGFSTRKFAKKYHLGNPVAGNFYQAQWDKYVPILQKKLGI